MRTTVVGVFADHDAALAAAERAREAVGPGSTVRTVGSSRRGLQATGVTWDRSGRIPVMLLGWVLGLGFAVIFAFAKLHWLFSLVAVLTGAVMGLMMAQWLTGEQFQHLPLGERRRFARLVRRGHALVLVDLADALDASSVSRLLHHAGGEVYRERDRMLGRREPVL